VQQTSLLVDAPEGGRNNREAPRASSNVSLKWHSAGLLGRHACTNRPALILCPAQLRFRPGTTMSNNRLQAAKRLYASELPDAEEASERVFRVAQHIMNLAVRQRQLREFLESELQVSLERRKVKVPW